MRSPGSRGPEKLPVNYSRGLLHEIPPIKPCGRLRHLRFAFSMHDDDDGVCGVGSGEARVLVGTRAAQNMALCTPRPPSPSRLLGVDRVDIVGVEVAWVLLGSDFLTM